MMRGLAHAEDAAHPVARETDVFIEMWGSAGVQPMGAVGFCSAASVLKRRGRPGRCNPMVRLRCAVLPIDGI